MRDLAPADPINGAAPPFGPDPADGVEDAEFVMLDGSGHETGRKAPRPSTPPPQSAGRHEPVATTGMAVLTAPAGMRDALAPLSRHGGPLFWAGGLACALCAFWIAGGHALFVPASAPRFEIVGLVADPVTRAGLPVLAIGATVANRGGAAAPTPVVALTVTARDGRVLRYKLGTNRASLPAGASHLFTAALAMPNDGVDKVRAAIVPAGD